MKHIEGVIQHSFPVAEFMIGSSIEELHQIDRVVHPHQEVFNVFQIGDKGWISDHFDCQAAD